MILFHLIFSLIFFLGGGLPTPLHTYMVVAILLTQPSPLLLPKSCHSSLFVAFTVWRQCAATLFTCSLGFAGNSSHRDIDLSKQQIKVSTTTATADGGEANQWVATRLLTITACHNVLWLESAKGIRNTDSIAAVAADRFNRRRSSAHAFGHGSFHLARLPHLLTLLPP